MPHSHTLVFLLALMLLSLMGVPQALCSNNYLFYMYGSHLCPHCRELKEFLKANYGDQHIYFCDISVNNTCREVFYKIVSALNLSPNLIGIPFTIVVVDNRVPGVIIGALTERELWDKLIESQNVTDKVPIYTAYYNGTKLSYKVALEVDLNPYDAVYFFLHGELPPVNTSTTGTNTTEPPVSQPLTTTSTTTSTNGTNTTITTTQTTTTPNTLPNTTLPTSTTNAGRKCTGVSVCLPNTTSTQVPLPISTTSTRTTTPPITSSLVVQTTSTLLATNTQTSTPAPTTISPSKTRGQHFISILAITVSLALVDSINPCTIYLYTLLLIAASISTIAVERRINYAGMIAVGLAFVLAVMAGYILLGLGLLTVMSILPKIFFVAVGIGFGLWVIYAGLTGKEKVVAKSRMVKLLSRASRSVLPSIALGLLATFTLLPCSAGPYVVFAGIASRLPLIQAIPLLLLYNTIFILPLLLVLTAVLLGVSRSAVREFLVKHNAELSILAGILLIIIAVYIAVT